MARTTSRESGSPTPHAVRADDVALELIELVARDAHVGQQADAGIDGVDGVVTRGQAVDERAGLFHLFARGWGESDFG